MSIYLDYNATTPVAEQVGSAMSPHFSARFANPASSHAAGREARLAVERAQEQVAELVNARPSSIVWTSGSTEAINTVLKGLAHSAEGRPRVVYSAVEHKAVLDVVAVLAEGGLIQPVEAPVLPSGVVDIEGVRVLVDEETLAVCVMAANNETGVVNDLSAVTEIAHASGALVVCDATQQVGKLPIDLGGTGVDYAAVSAHKLYGPKGAGALIVQPVVDAPPLEPLIHGGGHQGGLRSGTLNVPGIVGFGAAAEVASGALRAGEAERQALLRDRLERLVEKQAGPTTIHSSDVLRLPNTTNIRCHGVDADALIVNCPDVAMSSGSACTSSVPTPSHVLLAMGLTPQEAEESIRLSIGRYTTDEEVDRAAELIGAAAARIREVNR